MSTVFSEPRASAFVTPRNPAVTSAEVVPIANAALSRRWPRRVWLVQLVPPAAYLSFVISFFALEVTLGSPLLCSLLVLAILWMLAACVALGSRRFCAWLDVNRRQLALATTITWVTLVVADIALTRTGQVPTINTLRRQSLQYLPSTTSIHRLVPGQRLRQNHPTYLPVTINSRGYRGDEIAVPKPAGVTRIVVLGGSQVFDFLGGNWTHLLQERLSTGDCPIEVINAGVPGHRTLDSLGKLIADLWMLEPDAIVACEAWNDIKYFQSLSPSFPYCDFAPSLQPDWRISPTGWDALFCKSAFYRYARTQLANAVINSEGEARIAVGKAKKRKPGKVMGDEQWGLKQYELNLRALCETGRGIGARVVLCKQARMVVPGSEVGKASLRQYGKLRLTYDETVRAFEDCDRVVQRIAAEKGCPVIDIHASISGREEYFLDQIHFSVAGSDATAEVVAEGLRPILAKDRDTVTRLEPPAAER